MAKAEKKEKKQKVTKSSIVSPEEEAKVEENSTPEVVTAPEETEKPKKGKRKAKEERYDILLVSEKAGFKPSKAAIVTMVHQLAFRGFAAPVAESVAKTWLEIYFEPATSAHEVFWLKDYPSEIKIFDEVVLRVEDKPFFAAYGDIKRPLYWSIEFRNCLFQEPLGHFKKLFLEALNVRIESVCRLHEKSAGRREVPEDEIEPEKVRRERGAGLAGTHVEEL